MLHMNGFVKKAAAFMMGIALIGANTAAVRAAEPADLDLNRTGEIELTLADVSGETVSGGTVTIYEVAKLYLDDGNMAYENTLSFADFEKTLDVADLSLPAVLVEYVDGHSVSGEEKIIEAGGKVTFTDLELGLYLVVQTAESANYETISPFLVTVPMENNGAWDYTVDASPKVGTVTPIEEQTEGQTEEQTEELTEEQTEELTEEQTEELTEVQTEVQTESGTEVETEEETETAAVPSTADTTNTTTTTTLPQTGQLNWPIPLLAVGGFLFLILGFCLKNTKEKKDKYAS